MPLARRLQTLFQGQLVLTGAPRCKIFFWRGFHANYRIFVRSLLGAPGTLVSYTQQQKKEGWLDWSEFA
jgi:hypothetical protein